METPVKWNDPQFVWNTNSDFDWDQAYWVVQAVGAALEWSYHRNWKRKIEPELAQKFLEVVVKVNGLSKNYKRDVTSNPKIKAFHIQKTFSAFDRPKVKISK